MIEVKNGFTLYLSNDTARDILELTAQQLEALETRREAHDLGYTGHDENQYRRLVDLRVALEDAFDR